MCALPFRPRTPPNGAQHRLCPSAGRAQVRLRAAYSVHSLSYRCTAGRSKWQWYWTCMQAPNMVNYRAHMETFSMSHFMSHSSIVNPPSIHYISRDHPNAHELTNHIPHPSPAPGLAVAWCARNDVAQVVRNGSCVSNRHNCKFSQNALNGDGVENRFPVIKLV